ncbi:MAG TPA: kelch repeat-containing protein [Polyangiaceae bacterium]|jgi:hypothetical protein
MRFRFAVAGIGAVFFTMTQLAACGSDGGGGFDGGTDAGGGDVTTCNATQTLCGGQCVDTSNDVYDCGACGNTCAGGEACCSGLCVQTTCAFSVTSTSPKRGNQSGGDWVDLTGQGFTPDMSVFIGNGRAPALVIDATHARIQTPPGPVGTTDITLVNAQGSSTTHKAFTYISAGLDLPWQKKPMQAVRGEHPGIAVLQDGRVLIAGGTTVPDHPEDALATAEIFQRSQSGDTVTPAAGTMGVPRWRDAAMTMLDGRVLVVGGPSDDPSGCTGTQCTVGDLFDPVAGTFKATAGVMAENRTFVWAVLMVDGRVMITSDASSTVEVYDPKTDSFSTIALPGVHYFGQRIVRLRDGRVMVMGGDGCGTGTCTVAQNTVDIYDPKTNAFTAAKPMNVGRTQFTAHVLPDGRVMVFGGASISAGGVNAPLDSIEAYDPTNDTWTVEPYKLSIGRTWHASALVRDGTILVMGGYTQAGSCAPSDTVDQVDPVAGTVMSFGTLPDPNTEWNAVTMLDGSVLGVGGGACGGNALPDLDFLPGSPAPN